MVILNALFGLLLKLLSVYASIFDLVHFSTGLYEYDDVSIDILSPGLNFIIIWQNAKTLILFLMLNFAV